MKQFVRDNRFFLCLCLGLCLVLAGLLLNYDKASLHLALNSYHAAWLDTLMCFFSHEGIFIAMALVLSLCLGKLGLTCLMAGACAINGLLGQVVKHIFNAYRPEKWFMIHYPEIQLPIASDVPLAHFYSFPSGHTITFFTLAFAASIMLPTKYRKWLAPLFFVLAMVGSYSRIYMSMHFAADVLGGIILALLGTTGLYFATQRWHKTTIWNLKLWDLGKK